MKIGYSKKFTTLFLVLGPALIALTLLGRRPVTVLGILPGIISTAMGIAFLIRPYFTIHAGEVVVFAPLGPAKHRYPFASGRLVFQDGRLHAGDKKTPVRRWMADAGDWQAAQRAAAADMFA